MSLDALTAALQSAADAAGVRCDVTVLDAVDSTNTWLAGRPAAPAGEAQAVLALHQTAGRGRGGRSWQAPRGSGLCLSVGWTFARVPDNASALTLALGVAAARALESLGLGEAMLKWPNDLVWQDRKLGGILVESTSNAGGAFRAVCGIGVNLKLPDGFSLDDDAASWSRGVVDLATAQVDVDLATLAAAVLSAWLECLQSFSTTSFDGVVADFNERHWLRDRACELDGGMMRCGDVDPDGRLQVIGMQDGKLRRLESGEIVPLAWSVG